MAEIYLVVVSCSCPGDGDITAYTKEEEAIKHFEKQLSEDISRFEDELLEYEECNTIEELREKAMKGSDYAFDDEQYIWGVEVQTKTIEEKFDGVNLK